MNEGRDSQSSYVKSRELLLGPWGVALLAVMLLVLWKALA